MWVTWLAVVLSFWVVLAILQAFTGNGRCGQWLDLSGFRLCLFHLQWETTRFNRIFYRLGHGFPTMLDTWFGVGLVCSLCCMIWSVYLLCTALVHAIQIITASTSPPSTGQVLQLVVPGVNLPLEQLQFFLPALLFSAVIHEIGHAVAATRDSVGLNSCGIFLFVLYPGAFVNLHTTQLHHLSPMRQLRIYCAGVWHNMVLAIVALALLLLLPWLMLPGYQMGSGVVVTSVTKGSAMSGPLGLEVGDLVNKLGTCKVASNEDWTQCLMSSKQNVHGMCMSEELVRSLQTTATVYLRTDDIIECCDNHSLSDLCFSYSHEEMTNQGKQYACLPVRKALEMAGEHPCHTHADCPALLGPSICLQATLVQPARLLILYRPPTKPVLFVGDPVHLYHTVSVSSYIPRFLLLPRGLPPFLETFLKYVVSLSGALGLLNAVPCFALDGQWILAALLESVQWPKLCPPFLFVILTLGTGLLLANIVLGIVLLVH